MALVLLLVVAPEAAALERASASAAAGAAGIVRVGVDDFRFSEYSADFVLERDAEGRSLLTTTETFVAEFPQSDQNHGIRRAIPLDFQGYPTDVRLVSVTDGGGTPRAVDTETDGGFLLVTSAEEGFVHGRQSYVFTYTQHNVTLPAAGTASGEDEFFWDTNGTAWSQPFDRFDLRVRLGQGLEEAMTGALSCYRGRAGSTDTCSIGRDASGVSASGGSLASGENVTVAIGFAPGTFTPRDDRYFASGWSWVQLGGLAGLLIVLVLAVRRRRTVLRDAPGRPTVIAEYEPPAQGLFLSAALVGKTAKAPTAAFLDAAVRGLVRIEETAGGRKPAFALRVLDPAAAAPRRAGRPRTVPSDDRRFFDVAFGRVPGTVRELSGRDRAFGAAVSGFVHGLSERTTEAGLRRAGTVVGSVVLVVVAVLAFTAAFVGGVVVVSSSLGGLLPGVLLAVAVAMAAASIVLVSKVPLTAAGAELRDHVRGLTLYIRLAEADRLAVLQSPRGAERRAAGTVDVVEVTERLLPWAVLVGLEKQWAEALAVVYEREGEAPLWYSGTSGFRAAAFVGSVSSFSSSASSFVGSASSSSSGGAGGGGSSGGGGGGGGGGGV
ncbi:MULTISPECIES: DUF2207 family protein [unclassified Rathayibacter]|uniref:DUF2207 family protein n=1 Tax=unclassified Rathayibacter TaxID=2609250 RepID=UPI00188B38AE|nr:MULTISPECIES: DUF2207 domain-containing protein [unclassified Rathayibacter]MBF4463187.1 DUF2207 domain-containing protein [Rathayibacter sp. VKM Ac-2879]MBF4504576.1 DUF2207 domain-containing protein [Rathayibacter sp. VKM Ac-2878]